MDALEAARPGSARYVGGCAAQTLCWASLSPTSISRRSVVPDEVTKVMLAAGIAVHPTGIEHGTLTVVADHQPFEVTTLRRDVETDGRRAVVAFTEDWAEDAQRRDFRINALYADREGNVFDPTSGGTRRPCGPPHHLRRQPRNAHPRGLSPHPALFRFYAWYGREAPDAAGLTACSNLRAGLDGISAERIWMETKKLCAAPQPMPALEAMDSSGVMAQIFPETRGLNLLRKRVALEAANGEAPDAMLRFLSLFWKDPAATRAIANRLKLSNDERNRIVWPAEDETPMDGGYDAARRPRRCLPCWRAGDVRPRETNLG